MSFLKQWTILDPKSKYDYQSNYSGGPCQMTPETIMVWEHKAFVRDWEVVRKKPE